MAEKVMIGFAVFLVLFYGPPILYFKKDWFVWWFHDVLGWHRPDDSPQWSDGCSEHSRCKHCGKEIMQDSQGNWFC